MKKYELSTGILVTLNTEASYEKAGRKVIALPYWRYRTLEREIAGRLHR